MLHRFSDSVHGVDLPNHAMYPVFEDAWVTSWGSERVSDTSHAYCKVNKDELVLRFLLSFVIFVRHKILRGGTQSRVLFTRPVKYK